MLKQSYFMNGENAFSDLKLNVNQIESIINLFENDPKYYLALLLPNQNKGEGFCPFEQALIQNNQFKISLFLKTLKQLKNVVVTSLMKFFMKNVIQLKLKTVNEFLETRYL